MSEWQAKIAEDWQNFGAAIVWMRDDNGVRQISNGDTVWVADPSNPVVRDDVQPLRLNSEHLRALHIALLRYYDGADDARMLRKDYDAERARVDKLMEYAMNSSRS